MGEDGVFVVGEVEEGAEAGLGGTEAGKLGGGEVGGGDAAGEEGAADGEDFGVGRRRGGGGCERSA